MHPKLKKTILLLAVAFVAALAVRLYMGRLANDAPADGGFEVQPEAGVTVDTSEPDGAGDEAGEMGDAGEGDVEAAPEVTE